MSATCTRTGIFILLLLVKKKLGMPVYFKQTIKDQQRNTCTTHKTCLQDKLNSILYTVNNKITKSGHWNGISSCIFVCHLELRSRHNPPSLPHPIDLDTSSQLLNILMKMFTMLFAHICQAWSEKI